MLRLVARLYMIVVIVVAVPAVARGFSRSRVLRLVLLFSSIAQWVLVVVVLALRWVNPPTSAFMWRAKAGMQRAHAQADGQVPPTIEFAWVPETALSPEVRLAAIAGEDAYFAVHSGFDWESLRSARAQNKTAGRRRRGGSTISQQVAKNLFLWPRRSYLRKGIEAYITVLVEATWPKRRILEVYLNIAQFGPSTFGAEAASRRFFQKSALSLSRSEAALLVAALPNPHDRRVDAPERTMRYRQLLILGSMTKLGPHYLDRIGSSAAERRQ